MAADAARAKRLDDKHEQILREMLKLPGNKKCFDCTQKVSRSRSLEILATWLVLTHARSLARSLPRPRVDTRATTGASLCVLGLQHLCVLSLQRCSVRIELDTPCVCVCVC